MENKVEILITGDFYGGYRIEKLILNKDFERIFNDFLPLIRKADLAITNLEAPLLNNGVPIKKTGPAIKMIPETIDALKFAGFNLLTLANNHIMDYGVYGLRNTINLCNKNDIDVVGAGMSIEEATQTFYKKMKGLNIAIINIAENEWSTTTGNAAGAHSLNPLANFYKIQEARQIADFVIVIVHGGHEMYNLPSPRMKETYRFFIDAGADAVVGHHTHCYSGYEIYRNAPIFYSLGNFIFDSITKKPNSWYKGYALSLVFRKTNGLTFELIPYQQSHPSVGLQLVEDRIAFFEHIAMLNNIIQNDHLLHDNFNHFIDNELNKTYRDYLEPLTFKPLKVLQRLGIFPSFLGAKKKRLYLNLVRCEAHRDVIIRLLKNDCN